MTEGAVFPLFIGEGFDVELFRSFEEAESSLEGVDVADGVYVGYDADGRSLLLEASGVRRRGISVDVGRVRVCLAEVNPTHQAALVSLLLGFLGAIGAEVESQAGLQELVVACKRIAGYEDT